jgi:ubiquinone biosynthesis protein COQ4
MTDMIADFPPQPIKPIAALLAAARLIRNSQDTKQVALLGIALTGNSQRKVYRRFIATPHGQAVIRERRELPPILDNHDYLRSLPENSLGRHYLAFMQAEGLSAQGLLDATPAYTEHLATLPEAFRLFSDYTQRGSHDLHHILAGYGRDELGEACVLAMAYEHLNIRGYKVISTIGPLIVAKHIRRLGVSAQGVAAAVREAKMIGRRAEWIPALDIVAALKEDLDELRARLKLAPPLRYRKVVTRIQAQTGWRRGPFVDFVK